MAKTWRDKLASYPHLPNVKPIPEAMRARRGEGTIATPSRRARSTRRCAACLKAGWRPCSASAKASQRDIARAWRLHGDDGDLCVLREAVQSRHRLHLAHRDLGGATSERTVRPLGCFYWGKVWTLSAWCELRNDFRGFRVDRIDTLQALPDRFRDEPGKTLAEMLRRVQAGSI